MCTRNIQKYKKVN